MTTRVSSVIGHDHHPQARLRETPNTTKKTDPAASPAPSKSRVGDLGGRAAECSSGRISTAAASKPIASIQNTARHERTSVSRPPTSGPIPKPMA